MPILHYTTTVPARRTVMEIEEMLAEAGAKRVMKEFDGEGGIGALVFEISVGDRDIPVKIPIDVAAVHKILEEDSYEVYLSPAQKSWENAVRVAWRNVHHWIEVQIAFAKSGQVSFAQLMVSHMMVDAKTTVYERLLNGRYFLPEGRGEQPH